jgi:hypothetical protein
MSKGSMLKLIEINGRGRSSGSVALPGQFHSHSGWALPARTSNRPVQEPGSEELGKLNGGPLPGPLGHPATSDWFGRAEVRHSRLLVNKRVHRHAGA